LGPNVRFIRDRAFIGRTQTGRPFSAMGFEPVLIVRPPLRLAWIERSSSYRSVSFFPLVLPPVCVKHCVVEVSDGVGEVGRSSDRLGCAP
jgi:hypothetical protein